MEDNFERAIQQYNIGGYTKKLLRHNENMTYKIVCKNNEYLLRIHKPVKQMNLGLLQKNLNMTKFISDEMSVLNYLHINSKIGTQEMIPNKDGEFVTALEDGSLVTVLRWIYGETLENVLLEEGLLKTIGYTIAEIHNTVYPAIFPNRYQYDLKMLSTLNVELDTAYQMNHFREEQYKILSESIDMIRKYWGNPSKPRVLVHNDLGKSNLIYENGRVIPIDFSLCGMGIPELDLASLYCYFDNPFMKEKILSGYLKHTQFDIEIRGIDICVGFEIILFLMTAHEHIYKEQWLHYMVDEWCRQIFLPIIDGRAISDKIGLYS